MKLRLAGAWLSLFLLLPILGWPQVDTGSATGDAGATEEVGMVTPPPVSSAAYSTDFTTETHANILNMGVAFTTAYSSNVQNTANPVSDVSYSIWPTIAFDMTTTRLQWDLRYAPGFTFYQRFGSALNQGSQNVATDFQYRFSPHLTLRLEDALQKTNNPFNQPNPLAATSVSGSPPATNGPIISPVTDYLSNTANAQLTYQVRADGMVGFSGSAGLLQYLNAGQAPGLWNSNSAGVSAFYSQRIWQKYYVGVSYRYQDLLAEQAAQNRTQTQVQTIFLFGTIYLKPTLSLSISGGPQYYHATQAPLPAAQAWSPMLMASLSWQGQHTSLAASYSRLVSGGGGLGGTYDSQSAAFSGGWQASRAWTLGVSASYAFNNTLTPAFVGSSPSGHTLSATVTAQRPLGERLSLQAGYTWLQQSYQGIPATSAIPETNRVFVSVSYQMTRPLRR